MNVQSFGLVKGKESWRWALPILDQRQHDGLGSHGLYHIETNTLKLLNLQSHPKVRTPNPTIAGGVAELMIVIDIFKENHRFSN